MYCFIFLLLAGLVYAWLGRLGKRIIFKPRRTCWPFKLPFQPVQAGTLHGVYLPAKANRLTLVFFHGRGGNLSHFENFAATYAPLGYGILMFDYRGFGRSAGTPSQTHLEQDSLTVLHYALDTLHLSAQELVIYGHSLGNAPALFAAHMLRHLPFRALVLQSPFLSTPDVAASWALHSYAPRALRYRLARALVMPFLWFNRFDNTRFTAKLTCPVLLCSSKADRTLPWQQSAKLADEINGVQRFLSPTGGHDEFDWAAAAVDTFLRAMCAKGAGQPQNLV